MEKSMKIAKSRTWAEINLDALENNVNVLRKFLTKNEKFLAVIKADAYGHGLVPIAKNLEECKVDMFGVAAIQEGIELREKGIKTPILCIGQSLPELAEEICEYDITQAIENLEIGKAFSQKALELKKTIKIHIKIDTGMGRLGFYWPGEDKDKEEKMKIAKNILEVTKLPGLEVEGIFSHFADADSIEYSSIQIYKFTEVNKYLSELGCNLKIRHLAASVGIVSYPEARFDMDRFGLSLYGYASTITGNRETNYNLIPLMTVKSKITAVRKLPKDITIGYGCTYKLKRDSLIAVIPCGYADGFPRILSNNANIKIHNQLCPIVGRVCMDMIMVDVTDAKNEVKAGDVAIVFDEDLFIEAAQKAGTIIHEMLTDILPRVTRIYINKGKESLS